MNLKEFEKQNWNSLSLIEKIKWLWWELELRLLEYLKRKWD